MQTTYRSANETLGIYLPATLVEHWARRPEQSPLWGHWLSGSLMFCDISGFTAMSESLARRGKEGAELMAGVLNRFFERMITVADGWGGVQMKFGGDAMLLLFSLEEHAARAVAAGLEMQAEMSNFRHVLVDGNIYRLRMRVAIHSGRFFGASVGQPEGILHYLLLGPDVNRTAEIEGVGKPGHVVVSAEAALHLGDRCRLSPVNDGVARVRRLDLPPRPAGRALPEAPRSVLKRYLLAPLASPLLEGRVPSLSGEHRRVTAVFVNLVGVSKLLQTQGEAQALAQTDAYVKMLISALERHGGFLAGSDLATEGDKLICLFGAPLSLEQEEAAALRAVLELDHELASSDLDLTHRIGVSSGFVFAGEIGSSLRREYTVIGDSVNLAARLMAAARPSEILASQETIDRAGSAFQVQRIRPLQVKGKAAPVHAVHVQGAHSESRPEPPVELVTPLMGRERELATLLRLALQVKSRERTGWAYVSGEAGIGKSRLTSELAAQLSAQGWRQLVASSQQHTRQTPLSAWREPLRRLVGITGDEVPEAGWFKLRSAIAEIGPELAAFAPLLCELLSLPPQDNEAVAFLEPQERRRYLTSMVVELVASASRGRPLMLTFEDAHWADAPSLELLAAVLHRQDGRLLVLVTSRDSTPPAELTGVSAPVSIRLRELAPEAARGLVASMSKLPTEEIDKIVARAQGNPLFLQEISRMGDMSGESLPETVNDVILVRLDRLPAEEKNVLRLASVIGPSFSLEALQVLVGSSLERVDVKKALLELRELGFTREEAPEPPSFAFSHVLTREVAYETLPYARRRELHRRFAQHIEQRESVRLESACDLLLHHYEMASDTAKIARYAAMSGDRAAAVFASKEAMDYYRRSMLSLGDSDRRLTPDRSLLLERLGDCLEMTGRHREAAQTFSEALTHWRAGPRRPRLVPGRVDLRSREASLCRRVAASLERCSDYDESLRWLDEALAVLPSRAVRVGAQIYGTKSLALFRRAQYDQAVHWGRMGLALARRSGDRRQLAYAHHILASSYMEMGKLSKALHHDRLAVRFYHEVGDVPGQARANGNLGLSYQMSGTLDAALYHYGVALKADERMGNASRAAIVRNNTGEVLLMTGRLDEATSHLEQATSAERKEVAGLAELNLSRCCLRMGDQVTAMSHLRRGLRLLRHVGAQGLLTDALLQKVELRLAAGKAKEARRECRRVLSQAHELQTRLLEARGERLLGRAEAALEQMDRARSCLHTSILTARRAGASYEEALSLIELARVLLAAPGTRGLAARPLRRATGILSRMGAELDLKEAQELLEEAVRRDRR